MTLRIEHKRGDTFAPTAQFCQDGGEPASLVGYTVRSQLRDAGDALVHEFQLEITDAPAGLYRFLPVNTSVWPLGELYMDIEYTQGGMVTSTELIEVLVVKRSTGP